MRSYSCLIEMPVGKPCHFLAIGHSSVLGEEGRADSPRMYVMRKSLGPCDGSAVAMRNMPEALEPCVIMSGRH